MHERVGKYEVLTRISTGGMAHLFLAFLPGPGGFRKFVALKKILPEAASDEQFVELFLDEARITASLTHPNIAQVFDLGRDERSDELYLAMEFIGGQDLSTIMRACARQGRELPIGIACRVVRDLCLGLHAAHTFVDLAGQPMPVIHRDVSPKNVMVTYTGQVKVIDFGIALARGRLTQTQTGQVRGTLSYMSPEQLREEPVGPGSDLFSAGVVLHEALTGRRLYANDGSAILQILNVPPDDVRALRPDVNEALSQVVARALTKAPEGRHASGKAFARAIEEAWPHLADDDELSAFMESLFAPQRESSRALFQAAEQVDVEPAALTKLVRRLTVDERVLATPAAQSAPVVAAPQRARGRTLPAVVAAAALTSLGGAVWFATRPPAGTTTQSAAAARAPPTPPVERRVPAEALEARKRGARALAEGNFSTAEMWFEQALKQGDDGLDVVLPLISAVMHRANVYRAEELLPRARAAAVTDEDKSEVEYQTARVQLMRWKIAESKKTLRRAVELGGRERVAGHLVRDAEDWASLARDPELISLRLGRETAIEPIVQLKLDDYFSRGMDATAREKYEVALVTFEECTRYAAWYAPCWRMLGSSYAAIATRDRDESLKPQMRHSYEVYLSLAEPGDPQAARVRKALGL